MESDHWGVKWSYKYVIFPYLKEIAFELWGWFKVQLEILNIKDLMSEKNVQY